MQLKKPPSIRAKLSKATCLLLGTPAAAMSVQASEFSSGKWDFDSAILYYSEQNRVTAIEPVINAKQNQKNDKTFAVKLTLDVLSGASPNGAVPAGTEQTWATVSGSTGYSAKRDELPLDPTFQDTRFAANLTWDTPVTRQLKRVTGLNFSAETDYLSLGGSYTLTYDTNRKNTTLAAGVSVDIDRIAPVGGKPNEDGGEGGEGNEGLSAFLNGERKQTADFLVGVTQILDRKTLMQLNYSYGKTNGYMNDPYKLVSVVGSDGNPIVDPNNANGFLYYYEKRPDTRNRQSVYWKMNHEFGEDVFYISYRYFWDNWNIKSHTYDVRYRYQLTKHTYLQPHYRFYKQTAADFYRYFLLNGEPLPDYVSADYRLGALTTTTAGLLYGADLGKGAAFSFRVEYMKQDGEGHPANAVGQLRKYDLFPDFNALILQLNYSQKF